MDVTDLAFPDDIPPTYSLTLAELCKPCPLTGQELVAKSLS
jgi:hypothetical protein